ncbi:unnamed protein product, partial [Scytosiphon promiscuus]
QVSCGPSFCLAITPSNVWGWGTGEGFVLGLGDTAKRETPVPIEAFAGKVVLQVQVNKTLHVSFFAQQLYTWGSGYHGQLALG